MGSTRIDVDFGQAMAANAMASQAVGGPSMPVATGPAAAAPGLFAFVAATVALKSSAAFAAEAALAKRMGLAGERSQEAVSAYRVTDEENRQSLTAIQGG